MTSQVAVYNLIGIGIASDTVATNRSEAGPKTTGNSEKIYELGPSHKLVALHYGSTGLNDLHHQFQFNEWAKQLGDPFGTLEEYVHDYIRFTETSVRLHSEESELNEIRYLLSDHYEFMKQRMIDEAPDFEGREGLSQEEVAAEYTANNLRIIKQGMEYLQSLPQMTSTADKWATDAFAAKGFKPKDVWESIFDGFYLSAAAKTSLNKQASLVVARYQDMPWDSYLAFIGYGADEPFGGSFVLTCRSIIEGKFLYELGPKTEVGPGANQSEISRFAQGDAIESFLKGYNTDIMTGFKWAIGKHLLEAMGDSPDYSLVEEIKEKVASYIQDYSWKSYIQPMLRQINGMNLFGLSELARTLVGVQATSSAAKDGPISVGGLIEVVTIDRINGVQWKERLPR